MNAVPAKFDLLTVRSADVDRRSLSQAWFDALHLASQFCDRPAARHGDVPLTGRGRFLSIENAHSFRAQRSSGPLGFARSDARSGNAARVSPPATHQLAERRARVSQVARSIMTGLRLSVGARSVTLTIPQGRVCVYLVTGVRGTQIMALCPSSARDLVEKALAQVRYALAGGGLV